MQGFVFNTRRPIFQDPRVRQALGLRVRLRVEQQEPVLRRLHADQELLLELGAGLERPAERRGAEDPRAVPGQGPRRGLHQGVPAARRPTGAATSGTACGRRSAPRRGRLDRQGPEAGQRARGADAVRDPARRPHLRADRAALREEPRAARRHRARPDRRRRAVPEAAGRLRLRHDRRPSGRSRSRPATSSATSGARRPPASPGSRNLAGIKDPVVDKLIDLVIQAPDRPSLVARTRALDRVLLWGHYVIPHWHIRAFRVVYWDKFGAARRLAEVRARLRHLVGRRAEGGRPRPPQGRDPQVAAARADARLRRPPPPADRPDAVRHHGRQLHHRAGRAGRARRADDRPPARRTASRRRRASAARAAARPARRPSAAGRRR